MLEVKSDLSLALKIEETTMLLSWDFYVLQLLRGGGVPEPWNVTDVFGLDPDLLVMVPQPVKALILLFPMTEAVSWSIGVEYMDFPSLTRVDNFFFFSE